MIKLANMKKIRNEIIESSAYSQFITENREILSGLNNQIIELITKATEQNKSLDSLAEELIRLTEISSAMHLQYKTTRAEEETFKLKSVIKKIKNNIKADSIHLETAFYLAQKTETLISSTFTELDPVVQKSDIHIEQPVPKAEDLNYKWFTFRRNGSWFIVPFSRINIIQGDAADTIKTDSIPYIRINNVKYKLIDLMSPPSEYKTDPSYYIQFDSDDYVYASDINGRELRASADMVSPMIKPIKDHAGGIFRGRVRLFGINYLYPAINAH